MDKKVNEKKKKYAIVITFLVLMICITGGTYAYFALTASNNSVTGSVGGASLNLEVTKVYPTSEHNNKNMIPQLESTLDEAISLEHKCVDGNGNVICQVYSATVTNVGSTTSVLNGTISFEGVEKEAGLYDDNWNLLASWDELVNDYGMDIKYEGSVNDGVAMLSNIINDHPSLLSTSKIIVDDSVKNIGMYQFENLLNIKEVALPDGVIFNSMDGFYGLSSLKNIYYSGDDTNAPWGASNAVIKSRREIDNLPNLKWMRINDSNTLGTFDSYYASKNRALFEEERSFGANTSNTYYFVFWIDEIGEIQTDIGDFRAIIEFDSAGDGLTSTVRPVKLEPGLYDENGNMTMSWQKLIDDGYLTVNNGELNAGITSDNILIGKLIISNSVTRIAYRGFIGCSKLTSVTIPSSVEFIGEEAFLYCDELETVYFEHTKAPSFGINCFMKSTEPIITFYFKNEIVANSFVPFDYTIPAGSYNETYGIKSDDYNW